MTTGRINQVAILKGADWEQRDQIPPSTQPTRVL